MTITSVINIDIKLTYHFVLEHNRLAQCVDAGQLNIPP